MARLRAVLDTNVIISALLTEGPASKILQFWKDGAFALILSNDIMKEYALVLSREKFCLPVSLIKTVLDEFHVRAVSIEGTSRLNVVKEDPADNKFIETAAEGQAQYLISGDSHLLTIKEYNNIKIIPPQEFLTILNI